VIILFVLLAASPSQQYAIHALSKALNQVTMTSVNVTCNPEKKFLFTNTYQVFQAVLLIKEGNKTRRISTLVELFL
jgi:N-acetylmuramic acid 6-phosphate (MurNAc-6-P) etherase